MSFQTPITIAEAMSHIGGKRYLLPAIQREFVWPAQKIEWLFDSLMRGYPISSFLFWNVEDLSKSGYKFYEFLREFRERFKSHNEEVNVAGIGNFTAVLDGQQRLTSLYIGLRGSYASKERYRNWTDNEWSIPTRRLYLNITRKLENQEDDRVYEFAFLKNSETGQKDLFKDEEGTWFLVGKINELRDIADFNQYIQDGGLSKFASRILSELHSVVFTKLIINFFLEKEQNLDKALNIFIRINSGGQPLNFSDLIMSIAIANWKKDARKEIHQLVDSVQKAGFSISKDFIFKSYLYLFNPDIRFKVTNFSEENAQNFERDWEGIRDAILSTFELIRSFGYVDYTLVSKNAVIPILYYLYHRGIYREFKTSVKYQQDREIIKKWLHVILLKRVFGTGGADGTLARIRRAFTEDVSSETKINPKITVFPVGEIRSQIKQDIGVGEEFVEELLKTQKDDRYAFSILALLSPQLDYQNNDFHKDHLHPISAFVPAAIDQMELSDEAKARFASPEWNNSIINLQMLDGNENQSKQDKSLKAWFEHETLIKDRDLFRERCLIPTGASLDFKDFGDFADKRRMRLRDKLKELLGVTMEKRQDLAEADLP
jgi:uncharacterized protein with ParB-like and HNH nuclease domain